MRPVNQSQVPVRLFLLLPVIGVIGFVIAFFVARENMVVVRNLRIAPHATLDSPIQGPAIYTGVVEGPEGRTNPEGSRAAGVWWAVYESSNDNTTKVCTERNVDQMRLRDAQGRSASLAMFSNQQAFQVVRSGRDTDWSHQPIIDLGSTKAYQPDTLPAIAQRCAGKNRWFSAGHLPHGSTVEVFACYQDGVLMACDQAPGALVTVNQVRQHRLLRAFEATVPFVVAATLYWVAILVLVFSAAKPRFLRGPGRSLS